MVSTRLDFALQELAGLEQHPNCTYSERIQLYHLQRVLRFLKMFVCCYENWDCTGNKDVRLGSFMSRMDVALPENWDYYENWETFANQLLEKVEHFKPEIKEICLDLLNSSFLHCKCSTSDEIYDFTVDIYQCLEDFLGSKNHMIVPAVKEQIEALQEKLKFFGNLVKFTAERCICHDEELRDFMAQVQAWINKVASLSFLYWADQLEEETMAKLVTRYLDVLHQIKPCSPEAIRMFLGVLKASKSSRSDTLLMGQLVASSVDMLLEDPMASMEDSFKTPLRDGLIILITFLMDPPPKCGNDGNEIRTKADVVVDEVASIISSLSVREEKEGIPKERDFLKKIDILKEEIRENYVRIQDLPWSDFPRTNALGFVDFLLGNLKEMASSIPFAKCLVLAMQKKLISLCPYLKDLMEQQNESEELKDLWMRIISVAYAVEHVVDSCFFGDNQIWYKMICLSIFLEEIEFATTEVKKIRDEFVCNNRVRAETNFFHTMPKYAKLDEAVVGFKNEAEAIIDQVIGGSQELRIVSIVGMPGQGKTTLANKTYTDPSVKRHFHKLAWCFVSQVYQKKQLLLDILSDVTVLDDKVRQMNEEDLSEILYRCLKGQRYFIVLDDIWDIEAWNQLKESFPNDNNGSRIMFTSRTHSMASQAELGSSTHPLRLLSFEESWELLQKKLFDEDGCPAYLSELGLQIVEICEGLPLSIVVTSGVLARRVKDLNWWNEIATNLSSKILSEGCNNILELSYNHLPNILRPCFLYFGAFQQGKAVKVQKLTQLWVCEGFIPKIGTKRVEDVAKDFLMDLIGKSLVIVVKRSSNNEIKECRLHDLLLDFCLVKAEEERFLRPLKNSQYPLNMKYEQYRLNIHTEWRLFVESNPTALYAHSLLIPPDGDNVHPDGHCSFFLKFTFLRVLDLEYVKFPHGSPDDVIISLIHLRYLAIQEVLLLSPNIGNLQNLEVLRVFTSWYAHVPDSIWKMKRLRHIWLRAGAHFSIDFNVPGDGVQLDNVETLSFLLLNDTRHGEHLLRRLPKLRSLKLLLLDDIHYLVLDYLNNLESLSVEFRPIMYGPCAFNFPSTLKKLTLSGFEPTCSDISVIGKLPNLEVLKLLDFDFEEKRWYVKDEEFLELRFLKLKGSNIQQWNAEDYPFPCLQRLVLENLYELQEIPSNFGDMSTLNLIEVHSCSEGAESSVEEILNEQKMQNDGFEVLITREYPYWDASILGDMGNDEDGDSSYSEANIRSYVGNDVDG